LDLTGEAVQWHLDGFVAYADFMAPCVDCAYLDDAPIHTTSSGAITTPASILTPWPPGEWAPSVRDNLTGVRCARTP
jgi:hypothetical protein